MRRVVLPCSLVMGLAFTLNLIARPGTAQAQTPLPPTVDRSATVMPFKSEVVPLPTALPPTADDSTATTPLKPGDRLRLTVVGFPDLSSEQVIMTDGTIQLPMAGHIAIGGSASAQAVTNITEALKPYVRRPQVGLSILSLSPLRINVTGEVLQPGPRLLDPTKIKTTDFSTQQAASSPATLSDALALAGGITPNADLQGVVIRRLVPQKSAFRQQPEITRSEIKVDLWQVIRQGDLTADARIYDGDEIIVPIARISNSERQKLLTSTFAPTKITVQVVGEVQKPGQVEVAPTAGVSQAIGAAGGPTRDAKQDQIALFRVSPDGKLESQNANFGKDAGALQNGDLIVVGKKGSSKILDLLGRVLNPLSSILFLLK